MNKNFYVTTPIYYVNDKPHIGHMYTSLAADILSRFKKMDSYNTYFLTGTDEHGQKIEQSAALANIDPKSFVDTVSEFFKNFNKDFNISNDYFIRTTDENHKKTVQHLWSILKEKGFIYKGVYNGWYSVRDEAFYTETEVTTNEKNEKVAPTGAAVEWKEEECYFFKLSAFQDKLLEYYDNNKEFIVPSYRYNEVYQFVKSGLHDLAISRSNSSWGIKVPDDEKHVIYVWLDALTNYISALGYPETNNELYKKYWNNQSAIHLVGKDIIRFHCVYWPAFLMAADLPMPKQIVAHGWWLNEGEKISKSLGNVINPYDLKEKYGLDSIRYFLFREVNFGRDGDFSHKSIISRINSELANEFGNLVHRILSIVNKNYNGTLENTKLNNEQLEFLESTNDTLEKISSYLNKYQFHNYIEEAWKIIRHCNMYTNEKEPWKLIKEGNKEEAQAILFFVLELTKRAAIILYPLMPDSCLKILYQISNTHYESVNFTRYIKTFSLESHSICPKPQPVFKKYIEEEA